MRVLVAWCPDWPITAMGLSPADRVAVLAGNRVTAASAAARAGGVMVGQHRREAERCCPALVTLPRDEAKEAGEFEAVVAALATVSPLVEVTRPGMCALHARGPSRYFGGEEALCTRVAAVTTAALPASAPHVGVGLADGHFAATLAARRGVVVPAGENPSFLGPFPLSVLAPSVSGDPDLIGLLGRLGIVTLGDFAALPAASVSDRFGPDAARLHRLAQGVEGRSLQPVAPTGELSASAELDPPAERTDQAAFVARGVAADLVESLACRGLACGRLRIEAETEHGERLVRRWRHEGLLTPAGLSDRVRWQLDGWLSGTTAEVTPTAGITLLRLVADEVIPATGYQASLFGGLSEADRRAMRGGDRLRGMLGPDAVFTGVLQGGRSPADRMVMVPWGEPRPTGPTLPGGPQSRPQPWPQSRPQPWHQPWPGHHPMPAPALVHPSPLAAVVAGPDGSALAVDGRGQLSAVPAQLSINSGPWVAIVAWSGPWRADERWWDPPRAQRRCRFQVLTDAGGGHLCFVAEGHWWVEATYD